MLVRQISKAARTLVVLGLCFISRSSVIADVQFTDGTFDNSDWTLYNLSCGEVDISAGQEVTGGNPTYWRHYDFSMGPDDNGIPILVTYDRFLDANYTPSSSGAISTLSFSLDVVDYNDGNPHPASIWALVIKQDGKYFYSEWLDSGETWPNWEEVPPSVELCESDLIEWDQETCAFIEDSHPDFSVTGSEMQFGVGFYVPRSDGNGLMGEGGIDNFDLTIHQGAEFSAQSGTIVTGSTYSGSLSDTYTSNDTRWVIQCSNVTVPTGAITVVFEGLAPCREPDDELYFKIEHKVSSGNLQVTVDFYDYASATWKDARVFSGSQTDQFDTFHIAGSQGTFIDPNSGHVKTRVRVLATGATSEPAWKLHLDFIGWRWTH